MKLKGLRDGDTFPDAKTYSSLESDFKRLFEYEGHEAAEYLARSRSTQTCRKVSLTSEDKELIGELFRTTYESCKVAIVGAIFKDVFQPSLGAEPPSDATRERASVYGVCVATTPALQSGTKENDMLRKSISDELFITQVAKHISPTTSPDDHSSHTDANEPQQPMVSPDNPLRVYLEKAIEVAWGMLTIQPPMVIAFPSKEEYNHAVHDIDIKYWSKVSEYDLVFFHPAVYYTFNEKKPAVKAEVGNRKCDTCSK